MNAAQLRRAQRAATRGASTDRGPALGGSGEGGGDGPSFGDTLEKAIGRVDESQKTADENLSAFVAGEKENLHDVMISMNQAEVHFQLMNEVRNRGLDTYKELMRMQV